MSRSTKYLKIFAYTYLIFLYAPALLLPLFSFNASQIIAFPLSGFTTNWFENLLYQETLHEALKNSLIVAVSSSILGTILGVLASRSATRYDFTGKQISLTFILAPLVLPEIIVGVALLIVLIQLGLPLNLWSVVLGHTLLIMPFSILIMNSAFSNLDISLEEASMDLGENQFGTFYRVILPLVFEFDTFVRFDEVKSAEPPKKFDILLEKNSIHFCDDFLVASAFSFLEKFLRKSIVSLSLLIGVDLN